MSPADISWSDDTLVQPDVFVMDRDEAKTMDWARIKTLHLVIEVLSPTTSRIDRFTKRRLYQEVRVPTYWIVDPDARQIEVWDPDAELPTVKRNRIVWTPAGADGPLTVELDELLRPL
jgi:Uma2 family endonuclease